MSTTAEILMFQTRPITVTGMVQQIMRNRKNGVSMSRHRLVTQDELDTEYITQIVHGDELLPRGRRGRAKHRDRTAAYPRPRQRETMPRHVKLPFVKPTNLTELWHHEDLQEVAA